LTKKFARWFLPILVAVLAILTLVATVMASYEQPAILEVQEIMAYENYHEEDAQLYIVTYYISGNYTIDADELFLFQLLDDDDDAVVTKAPYPFHDNGYGLGVVAFYLDASDALTWGGNASVKLVGNPMVEWDGDIPNTVMDVITWNTGTTVEIEELVSSKVLALAADLEESWDIDMVTTSDGVTILTDNGSTYFINVIPYLQTGAPSVFGQYVFAPHYPIDEKPASDSYADWLTESIEGTVFDISPTARSWGMSRGALTAVIYYGFVILLLVMFAVKRGLKKGLIIFFDIAVIIGAFIGIPLMVTIMWGFFCVVTTSWVVYKGTT
jgi:hypothetical protein